jgi:Protein of unknown function (DUF2934)
MSGASKHQARVRAVARELWEQEGKPEGREADYFDRARIIVGIEENPQAGQLPNPEVTPPPHGADGVEEADLQENLGEFPSRFTDQGDRPQAPTRRH